MPRRATMRATTSDRRIRTRVFRALPPRIWSMPRTVLIVHDERDTNEMLAAMIQTRNFKPIQLFSGSQVLGAVREHEPALILLDLMLPDIDGFAVCESLKRNRETNLIPIIMVTALHGAKHRADGVRVG